ncbi:MAG TPA: hypothetical protein DCP57_12150, partial [Gammaproteobacteria bacterium]|nr:hypothetical protein [Gammaproteobacteria bacterium]
KQRVLEVKLEIKRCFDNHKDCALSGVMTRCASSNGDKSWGVPLGIGLVTVEKKRAMGGKDNDTGDP